MKYERPSGFEKEKRDCTVRALSVVANMPYAKVHKAWQDAGRRNGCGVVASRIFQQVCKSLGLQTKQVKRSGTLRKLILEYPKGRLFCLKRGHAFALIDGVVHDEEMYGSLIKGAWVVHNEVAKNAK